MESGLRPTLEGAPEPDEAPGDEERPSELLCAACGTPVTSPADAVAVAGSHRHVKTNPAGFTFEIGCFRRAPGAESSGRATAEHSWFAGYRWRYASCGACAIHLGWTFAGSEPPFFGLILERLVAGTPDR